MEGGVENVEGLEVADKRVAELFCVWGGAGGGAKGWSGGRADGLLLQVGGPLGAPLFSDGLHHFEAIAEPHLDEVQQILGVVAISRRRPAPSRQPLPPIAASPPYLSAVAADVDARRRS